MFLCIASMVILGSERDIANAFSIYVLNETKHHSYDSYV